MLKTPEESFLLHSLVLFGDVPPTSRDGASVLDRTHQSAPLALQYSAALAGDTYKMARYHDFGRSRWARDAFKNLPQVALDKNLLLMEADADTKP